MLRNARFGFKFSTQPSSTLSLSQTHSPRSSTLLPHLRTLAYVLAQASLPPVSITSPWQGMIRSNGHPATILADAENALWKERPQASAHVSVAVLKGERGRGEGREKGNVRRVSLGELFNHRLVSA